MGLNLALVLRSVIPARGGAETYVADLARRLVRDGHTVNLVAEAWDESALAPEVRKVQVAAPGWSRASRIKGFAEGAAAHLESEPYDCSIGFINTWGTDILIPQGGVHPASVDCNAMRFPAGWRRDLYRLAKHVNPRSVLYRSIEAKQYAPESPARYVAVSHFVRGHLQRYHGVDPERISVIPNAIDPTRLAAPDAPALRDAFRRNHCLEPDERIALFVAHNFKLKGLGPLIDALAWLREIKPEAPRIKLMVCGGGNLAPFRLKAAELGVEDRVAWVGYEPDIRGAFHASDFFVLPSYYDPCSLVVLEALACGLPVITTACNGAGELITPGVEGYVVPSPSDRNALAYALAGMANDDLRGQMALAARGLAERWTFDSHVSRLVWLCESVAAARRGSTALRKPHRTASHVPIRST